MNRTWRPLELSKIRSVLTRAAGWRPQGIFIPSAPKIRYTSSWPCQHWLPLFHRFSWANLRGLSRKHLDDRNWQLPSGEYIHGQETTGGIFFPRLLLDVVPPGVLSSTLLSLIHHHLSVGLQFRAGAGGGCEKTHMRYSQMPVLEPGLIKERLDHLSADLTVSFRYRWSEP